MREVLQSDDLFHGIKNKRSLPRDDRLNVEDTKTPSRRIKNAPKDKTSTQKRSPTRELLHVALAGVSDELFGAEAINLELGFSNARKT